MQLDYTIQSPQERNKLVHQIIQQTPPENLTHYYLQILADYLIFAMTKEERKNKTINTDNRMVTINKREISFEGLSSKFENGQDSIYSLITNDKNIIFTPKISITQADVAEIPALRDLRQAIARIQEIQKSARGRRKFLLKKQIIQMRQDQYVIKNSIKQPVYCLNAIHSFNNISFDEDIKVTAEGQIIDHSLISFFNPKHISALLCHFYQLKQHCQGKFYTDGYYLIWDLENLINRTLRDAYPLYYRLLQYKIQGKQNIEIQDLLNSEFNILHSIEYISALWRNKIPKLLAEAAETDYIIWYYTMRERGRWKKCSRCGQIKLAHNKFFSKNNSSKDGFYSICKSCRNAKSTNNKSAPKIIKRIPYVREGTKEDK